MKPWALVTGASRGIGAAIALRLSEEGHPVLLNYREHHEAAADVARAIEAAGGRVETAAFDVADADACSGAIDAWLDEGRDIGVIVNNAGIVRDAAFPAMKPGDWRDVTRTTLDGFYNVTRPLVMPMVRRRWGRIVNVSSISGIVGNRGQVNYSAAKAGLIGATRALARELAKRGITVNAVAPGLIDTDMTRGAPLDDVTRMIPMRRLGRADEVARLVAFLAGEDAGYITGQVIAIDGGLS